MRNARAWECEKKFNPEFSQFSYRCFKLKTNKFSRKQFDTEILNFLQLISQSLLVNNNELARVVFELTHHSGKSNYRFLIMCQGTFIQPEIRIIRWWRFFNFSNVSSKSSRSTIKVRTEIEFSLSLNNFLLRNPRKSPDLCLLAFYVVGVTFLFIRVQDNTSTSQQ